MRPPIHTVIATARSAFNHVEVWQTLAGDLQLVCSTIRRSIYSVTELRERIASAALRDALAIAWKVHDVEGFLSHFVGQLAVGRRDLASERFAAQHGRPDHT